MAVAEHRDREHDHDEENGFIREPSPLLSGGDAPLQEKPSPLKPSVHPVFFILIWIMMSSGVIIFNKWILDMFRYPITLTTIHLAFATVATQILAKTTSLLDGRKRVKMTGRVYFRAVVPIGLCFSLSLVLGNETYLYLSLAFIQMLKAITPVAVLFATWSLGLTAPNMKVLLTVSIIVLGVMISSYGEIRFVFFGFLLQCGGVAFEAMRLALMQYLLSSDECKMDPLVSLYYFAPVCTAFNVFFGLIMEAPTLRLADLMGVGIWTLLTNALLAFGLNVSQVFLIGKTSSLVLCLCGIPKAIMLVLASMIFWGTPVTLLQMFGFAIATAGLVHYTSLGNKKSNDSREETKLNGFASNGSPGESALKKISQRLRNPTSIKFIALGLFIFLAAALALSHNPTILHSDLRFPSGAIPPEGERHTFAYATFLSGSSESEDQDDDSDIYFVSTRVLAYQLLHVPETRTLSSIPLVVLVTPDVTQSKRARLELDGVVVIPVDLVVSDWATAGLARWKSVLTKMRLFELVQYEKVLFMDSDMLINRPLDGIFQDPSTTVMETLNVSTPANVEEGQPPPAYAFAGNPEAFTTEHDWPPPDGNYLNAGFFVFTPSLELFQYYMSLLQIPDLFNPSMPEQNLLNYAHRKDGNMPWQRLHYGWNINWPTVKDLNNGVASMHDKYWNPLDRELGNRWLKLRWEMAGYYRALEKKDHKRQ